MCMYVYTHTYTHTHTVYGSTQFLNNMDEKEEEEAYVGRRARQKMRQQHAQSPSALIIKKGEGGGFAFKSPGAQFTCLTGV
jgi:hypothetical protein